MAYKTNLGGSTGTFAGMMKDGFGIVTVMDAKIYKALDKRDYESMTAYEIAGNPGDLICELDTLKIANVTMEGPTKTITGGQYSNPLIKFGKSARLEMQDALGNSKAIEALCGGIQEWKDSIADANLSGLHFGEDFVGPKMIIGDSFFIDRVSGQQVKVKIVFYQFLPDSIFNLTQDAEGDATVFDMNGDLLTTNIKVGRSEGDPDKHGVFYSILKPEDIVSFEVSQLNGVVTVSAPNGDTSYTYKYSTDGGLTWNALTSTAFTSNTVIDIAAVKDGDSIRIRNNFRVEATSSN